MTRRSGGRLLLVCALVAAAHGPAAGLTLVPASFSEMVEASAVIVHGRVRGVESRMAGPRRSIERVIRVEVIDAMKGGATEAIVFRVPGGQVGRYRRVVPGVPEFAEGDEVVVFLQGRPPAVPTPFGVAQGVFRVSGDPAHRVVVPPHDAAGPIVRGDVARRPLPVGEFSRVVRALAGSR